MMRSFRRRVCGWLGCATLVACQSAGDAPSATLEPLAVPRLARVWRSSRLTDGSAALRQVSLASIDTSWLQRQPWYRQAPFGDMQEDLEEFVELAREGIEEAFDDAAARGFTRVDDPDQNTVVLEIAFVTLVPPRAYFERPWLLDQSPGVLVREESTGLIGIEGRVRAGPGGDIIALFSDQQRSLYRPELDRLARWYSHAEPVLLRWSKDVVAIVCAPGEGSSEEPSFVLSDW